jgi:hypothetical protein
MLNNINKIDEFTTHFNNLNLRYVERIRGFDPNGFFLENLLAVGLEKSFFQRHMSENRDTNDKNYSYDVDNLDTLQSTIELYKK